ncbi:MAG: ferrous iron transport protein B [Planctomycetes bacterium]|nr:ferrous iron transport protein B [Planctomycetota bacterium]
MSGPASTASRVRRVAIIGNPNTGKTTLFNALTGLRHRVGNYPGVTVEKKIGKLGDGLELIDLPGTYSLAAHSPDEMVAVELLLGHVKNEPRPNLVVVIADAGNLSRNLYLATQVMELGLPTIVALNMVDAAEQAGVKIDCSGLAAALGVPVIPTVAHRNEGVKELRETIIGQLDAQPPRPPCAWPEAIAKELHTLRAGIEAEQFLIARALIDEGGSAEEDLARHCGEDVRTRLKDSRDRIRSAGRPPAALEAQMRYAWIGQALAPHQQRTQAGPSLTDRLDAWLTHRVFGTTIFAALMTLVFMTIFSWAAPLMELVDGAFGALGEWITALLAGTSFEGGILQSLLVEGVIAGVGGVLVFLPQIILLFLFIAILEDCGYMARAAFLMDRLLRFCGLSGHSFIPMMSSFACAIPGVMAARTIHNPRDRLTTILVAPLMSCSARIPVYAIMIAAFVPVATVWGVLNVQGMVFAGMYFVGILTAIPVALLLKRTLLKGPTPPFVMELPTYKMPGFKTVFFRVWEASVAFTLRAGTIIFAISVIIWALSYFPHSDRVIKEHDVLREEAQAALQGEELDERLGAIDRLQEGALLRDSYFGRMGQVVEPVFRPLGWDWRISMAAIASFPAREVIVSTLGIIYDLGGEVGDDEDGESKLASQLQASKRPDGSKVFNLAVALSIMVFFALCCQCGATVATIKRETNSWKWAAFTFGYMTALAYVVSLATYQIAIRLI